MGTLLSGLHAISKQMAKRRIIGSYNHGSMANAMMHAIGAQNACPNAPSYLPFLETAVSQ